MSLYVALEVRMKKQSDDWAPQVAGENATYKCLGIGCITLAIRGLRLPFCGCGCNGRWKIESED